MALFFDESEMKKSKAYKKSQTKKKEVLKKLATSKSFIILYLDEDDKTIVDCISLVCTPPQLLSFIKICSMLVVDLWKQLDLVSNVIKQKFKESNSMEPKPEFKGVN